MKNKQKMELARLAQTTKSDKGQLNHKLLSSQSTPDIFYKTNN